MINSFLKQLEDKGEDKMKQPIDLWPLAWVTAIICITVFSLFKGGYI